VQLKDYYTILELSPSASLDEIKKAYRRLALIHHPDKKGNDPYAAAQFSEIKEAYETLTHPAKKDLYLQQRWYAQSIGQRKKQEIITPVSVLKQLIELERYTAGWMFIEWIKKVCINICFSLSVMKTYLC